MMITRRWAFLPVLILAGFILGNLFSGPPEIFGYDDYKYLNTPIRTHWDGWDFEIDSMGDEMYDHNDQDSVQIQQTGLWIDNTGTSDYVMWLFELRHGDDSKQDWHYYCYSDENVVKPGESHGEWEDWDNKEWVLSKEINDYAWTSHLANHSCGINGTNAGWHMRYVLDQYFEFLRIN